VLPFAFSSHLDGASILPGAKRQKATPAPQAAEPSQRFDMPEIIA
jgi:hypothetical protein